MYRQLLAAAIFLFSSASFGAERSIDYAAMTGFNCQENGPTTIVFADGTKARVDLRQSLVFSPTLMHDMDSEIIWGRTSDGNVSNFDTANRTALQMITLIKQTCGITPTEASLSAEANGD